MSFLRVSLFCMVFTPWLRMFICVLADCNFLFSIAVALSTFNVSTSLSRFTLKHFWSISFEYSSVFKCSSLHLQFCWAFWGVGGLYSSVSVLRGLHFLVIAFGFEPVSLLCSGEPCWHYLKRRQMTSLVLILHHLWTLWNNWQVFQILLLSVLLYQSGVFAPV